MTRMITAELAVPAQCELAEGPIFDADRGVLRWVDILAGDLHSFDPSSGARTSFGVGEPVGTVGLTSSGELIVALASGFALVGSDGTGLTRIGDFTVDTSVVRFNDGKPDPWGNFWAGTMPWVDGRPGAALYRLTPDGQVSTLIPSVGLSNGLDWTDDHRTFYYADSDRGTVDAFDCDPVTGELGERRTFVEIPAAEGVPDGLTLDADGCLWLAVWGAGEVRRYTPSGQLDTVVRIAASQASCPAFGPDGTLYITTAYEGFNDVKREAEPHAGDIFACAPGVASRPPFRFRTR